MKRCGIVCLAVFLGCTVFFSVGFSQRKPVSKASPPLRLIQEIPLPGVQGPDEDDTINLALYHPNALGSLPELAHGTAIGRRPKGR
jgi:hypothetical protein